MIPPARPGFSGSQAALSGSGASARGLPSVAFFHSTPCFLLELSAGLAQWRLSSDPLHCQGRQPLHACIQRSCSHCIDGVLHCPRHVQGPVANWPACMAAMHGLLRYSGITLLALLYSMVLACAEESEIGRAKRPASSHCVLGPEQAAWLSAYSRLGMTTGRSLLLGHASAVSSSFLTHAHVLQQNTTSCHQDHPSEKLPVCKCL